MYEFSIEENLQKKLKKLFKKDKIMYEILMKKFEEIIMCEDINHYKNLRKPLQEYKRVHIKSSFVLIFKFIQGKNEVSFYDFNHHDIVY